MGIVVTLVMTCSRTADISVDTFEQLLSKLAGFYFLILTLEMNKNKQKF